jgi:hypothetical protein
LVDIYSVVGCDTVYFGRQSSNILQEISSATRVDLNHLGNTVHYTDIREANPLTSAAFWNRYTSFLIPK